MDAAAPVAPAAYIAKAKNLLLGLPPTDNEVQKVTADPSALKALIQGWMSLPEYTPKMTRFFELAFQQTQVRITDFADQTSPQPTDNNGTTAPLLLQNFEESFARTALELAAQGRPFTDVVTTQSFMMTPALMEFYAFLDEWEIEDDGTVTDLWAKANPNVTITVESSEGPIPIAQSLERSGARYMHWYDPDLAKSTCRDPLVYPASGMVLHHLLYGWVTAGAGCGGIGGSSKAPQLQGSDFTAWRMVTIRKPARGEAITPFYDLPALRSGKELVLEVPRVGFFSTPAFAANWQTNASNQMRVTANQAFIVALGAMFDGSDSTTPPKTPGLDVQHASEPACYGCHKLLDPTRSIFSATYSWNYHYQTESALTSQPGLFAFQGVIDSKVSSIEAFSEALATHPLFAQAWVQKLCYYANSAPCETTDPEFQRIVSVFKSSNYSWNTLVAELLSSPLTTYAMPTQTSMHGGEVIAVSRRDHFCAALNVRLGFTDICGLDPLSAAQEETTIPKIVSGLPSDGYGRGAVAPILPNQPTLFFRAATENICESVAALVVDAPASKQVAGVKQWSSQAPDAAIADFVGIVMGLPPSDRRAAGAETILKAHFTAAAKQAGITPTDALRSTFVTACLSPSSVSMGL